MPSKARTTWSFWYNLKGGWGVLKFFFSRLLPMERLQIWRRQFLKLLRSPSYPCLSSCKGSPPFFFLKVSSQSWSWKCRFYQNGNSGWWWAETTLWNQGGRTWHCSGEERRGSKHSFIHKWPSLFPSETTKTKTTVDWQLTHLLKFPNSWWNTWKFEVLPHWWPTLKCEEALQPTIRARLGSLWKSKAVLFFVPRINRNSSVVTKERGGVAPDRHCILLLRFPFCFWIGQSKIVISSIHHLVLVLL